MPELTSGRLLSEVMWLTGRDYKQARKWLRKRSAGKFKGEDGRARYCLMEGTALRLEKPEGDEVCE